MLVVIAIVLIFVFASTLVLMLAYYDFASFDVLVVLADAQVRGRRPPPTCNSS
jgi:hypothetical protein